VGKVLVAFLEAVGSDAFRMTSDDPGLAVTRGALNPSVVFLVQDGRIRQAPSEFSHYVGMPIDAFLEELRTLSRRN